VDGLVERMRVAFLGGESDDALSAEISVSVREASDGVVVPLNVPLRSCCKTCGGRGELWAETCCGCQGSGTAFVPCHVQVTVPPGVSDGARFSFSLTPRDAPPTRVDLRVAIR
jgi:DnaJ-class molecular chaperone